MGEEFTSVSVSKDLRDKLRKEVDKVNDEFEVLSVKYDDLIRFYRTVAKANDYSLEDIFSETLSGIKEEMGGS